MKVDLLKKRGSEIYFAGLLVFSFLIPNSPFLSTRLLVLLLILSPFVPSRNFSWLKFSRRFWDLIFYFGLVIFGLSYSQDLYNGLKVLETSFSLLAIPIVLIRIDLFDENKMNRIFLFFVSGVLLASGISIINSIVHYAQSNDIHVFFSYEFTEVISSHPTYLAYYLIFGITFGLYFLYYNRSDLNPYLIAGVLIFFFIMLMLTGGRTAFISVLLVFSFFALRFLIGDKSHSKKITFILVMTLLASMFFINSFNFGNRDFVVDDSWERFALWESAINATPSIFWGAGTGDSKLLNEYYLSHNMSQFAEGSYNAHNQFIQFFFTNGLLGLLAVLIMIGRPLYLSVRHQNTLGVLVFFPFLIYGMTEVFLGRYQGVVFFALLHQCFITHYQSDARASALKSS